MSTRGRRAGYSKDIIHSCAHGAGLGGAVPDGRISKSRRKGELREPGEKVRREVVAALQACSGPLRKGNETPLAQVASALMPWWGKNQDSTLPEVLADLISPPSKGALATEIGRLTQERDDAVAEAEDLRMRAEKAEAEAERMRRKLAKAQFLFKDDEFLMERDMKAV